VEINYFTILSTTFPEHYNSVRCFILIIEALRDLGIEELEPHLNTEVFSCFKLPYELYLANYELLVVQINESIGE
jgi:hypothetical protein